jgi:hypothetical protein
MLMKEQPLAEVKTQEDDAGPELRQQAAVKELKQLARRV